MVSLLSNIIFMLYLSMHIFTLPPFSSCCASAFTWASTSDSEAQEARDRHNCRACGGLVCEQCSKNKCPVPDIGLLFAVRVCDRCYHDMGNVVIDDSRKLSQLKHLNKYEKNERFVDTSTKTRRNMLVDELAMKMPSITGS